jgi:hypothetical protein
VTRAHTFEVGEPIVLAVSTTPGAPGKVLAVLNYGHTVTVQWPSGTTTTHKAESIRRAS